MSLASPSFLLFLLVAVTLYRQLARWGLSLHGLVFLCLVFYALWNPLYCLPLLLTATADFLTGRWLSQLEQPAARRLLLAADITLNLTILGFFKYFNFVSTSLLELVHQFGWALPPMPLRVVFAVGISFYTLQSMSYVIDVYRKDTQPTRSFLEYVAFVSFFPTVLAGPITRADTLLPQLRRGPAALTDEAGGRALFLIALGLIKKVVIADFLAVNLVNRVFDLPGMYSSAEVLAGIYAFAVQIYCDFSGYSDIAIGAALLLGIQLKDNFNSPYRAKNMAEFWRRWHISLSTWLRDYLFFSLPGNRSRSLMPYLNLVITFGLGGLWHGASWTFLIWGIMHGAGLAAVRLRENLAPRPPVGKGRRRPWVTVAAVGLTFHFVCATWVFFRCSSLAQAGEVFSRLGSFSFSVANLTLLMVLAIVAGLAVQWLPEKLYIRARDAFVALPAIAQGAVLLAVAAGVRLVGSSAVAPFIYFNY